MKKIFACTNGIEFFSDGESVLGTLSKEEATDFMSDVAIDAAESGDTMVATASLMLLRVIDNSYIQLPKTIEVEIVVIVTQKIWKKETKCTVLRLLIRQSQQQ